MFNIEIDKGKELDMAKLKTSTKALLEIKKILPTLQKHGLAGQVQSKVKELRADGRKSRRYTIKVSRTLNGKKLEASDVISAQANKLNAVKQLKEKVIKQIQQVRASTRPQPEMVSVGEVTVPRMDLTYTEFGSILKAYKKKLRKGLFKSKTPWDTDNFLGIEIEVMSKTDKDTLAEKIFDAGIAKHCHIKSDGSISHTTEFNHPHEITVLCKESEMADVITKLSKILVDIGAKVDKSCGLHVHLDMRSRDVAKCYTNFILTQQFLYGMLPAARRSSRYSYPTKLPKFRTDLERYHGVNATAYSKYHTLELRMHSGTIEAEKIINWVNILISIADAPVIPTAPTSISGLLSYVNLTEQSVNYMKKRIAKFEKQHRESDFSNEEPNTMPKLDRVLSEVQDETVIEQSEIA